MEKLFVYDLETTGVMFWKNGIHQISGIIVIDGEEEEEFDFRVRPHNKAVIEPKALEVGSVTEEQIMAYPTMAEVKIKLDLILGKYIDKYDKKDKFHLMGYNNGPFDNPFLRAFFVQCNDNYFGSNFWSDSIDVMSLASNALRKKRSEMKNFKLQTVAETLGVPFSEEEAHDALYDVRKTYECYLKI
jgi:DNA polymerase-3 subunit epsilon